tara:strand:- start:627 stop:1208 length:582 start_codon:yes stop_codon:yes gene_type:complete
MQKLFENWRRFKNESSKRKLPTDLIAKGKIRPGSVWAPTKKTDLTKTFDIAAGHSDPYELAATAGGDPELELAIALGTETGRLYNQLISNPGMNAKALSLLKQRVTGSGFSRNVRQRVQRALSMVDNMPKGLRVPTRVAGIATIIIGVMETLDDYTTAFNNNEAVADYNREQLVGDYRVLYNAMKSYIIDVSK